LAQLAKYVEIDFRYFAQQQSARADFSRKMNSLYDYADQHAGEIAVRDGKISISDETLRTTFDALLDRSKALHGKLESTVQEEVRLQQQANAKIAE